MNRKVIGWIVAAVFAVGVGALAFVYFAGGSGEPSTELTTPTIAGEDSTTTSGSSDPTAGSSDTTSGGETPSGGAVSFVIDAEQSVATFEIDETLRGSPNHVVGTTSEVAGQVQADLADLSSVQFSQIIINARTFQTDSSFRDRAIRGPIILNSASDEFEFITFDVRSVEGLSGSASVGDQLTFTVTGDLTIRGETSETVFDVTATLSDESTITGTAETTVMRADFGIGIPNAPGVADVSEQVLISLDFVASAA